MKGDKHRCKSQCLKLRSALHYSVVFIAEALPGESLLLTLANNSLPIASIKVSPLNDMMFGIHPVHSMSCIVNGQSIGPEEVCIRNDAPIRAIHVGILNTGSVAPVSPVDSTGGGREKQLENLWPTYHTQHHSLSGQNSISPVTSSMRLGHSHVRSEK